MQQFFEEILNTEENYVKVLHILSIKLVNQVKVSCEKDLSLWKQFNELFQPLIRSLKEIYKLHHRFILPEMIKFDNRQRDSFFWTIIEEKFDQIEELYKNYYVIFDDLQEELEGFSRSNLLIDKAMRQIQNQLGNLYPITRFNCANERLLR